jgi:hydrogenase expression/formation protein HypE
MKKDKILLTHGGGGSLTKTLIEKTFLPSLKNPILGVLDDSAVFKIEKGQMAFSTDSYVVNPLFFAGGDIGKLAICGTVNDLAMSGARPLYLSASFIIEEGFLFQDLKRIITSVKAATREAKVNIIAGDTKVVNKGNADGLFITTTGIGIIKEGIDISGKNAQVGDAIIVSGYLGDHGVAIISEREGLDFETKLISDCAPLNHLVADMLKVSNKIHTLRDPTRGGLATILNEIAQSSQVGLEIFEEKVPIRKEVRGACEMLGYDPLYVANEGKLVAFVAPGDATKILKAMHKNKYGKNARIIGKVVKKPEGRVILKTRIGGSRILDMLLGAQLPRIC